jgi:hypothetical protein
MKRLKPFSNGTEAMVWLEMNCESCSTKCHFKRNVEDGFIMGDITISTAVHIGYESIVDHIVHLNRVCQHKDKLKKHRKTKSMSLPTFF